VARAEAAAELAAALEGAAADIARSRQDHGAELSAMQLDADDRCKILEDRLAGITNRSSTAATEAAQAADVKLSEVRAEAQEYLGVQHERMKADFDRETNAQQAKMMATIQAMEQAAQERLLAAQEAADARINAVISSPRQASASRIARPVRIGSSFRPPHALKHIVGVERVPDKDYMVTPKPAYYRAAAGQQPARLVCRFQPAPRIIFHQVVTIYTLNTPVPRTDSHQFVAIYPLSPPEPKGPSTPVRCQECFTPRPKT
jgi:hypothetical protein